MNFGVTAAATIALWQSALHYNTVSAMEEIFLVHFLTCTKFQFATKVETSMQEGFEISKCLIIVALKKMIISNSFVTPVSVRTETLQKILHLLRFLHISFKLFCCLMFCVLYCCVTHCYLCSSSSLPGTLELFVGICWREPVCKQWNINMRLQW